jgi:hypothetical protein
MDDDEKLHKYYFICKDEEFNKERKMILSKKCIKKLEKSIELIKEDFYHNIHYEYDNDGNLLYITSVPNTFENYFHLHLLHTLGNLK